MLLEVNFLCFLLQSVWAQCTVLRAPEQQLRFPDSDSGPSAPLPGWEDAVTQEAPSGTVVLRG